MLSGHIKDLLAAGTDGVIVADINEVCLGYLGAASGRRSMPQHLLFCRAAPGGFEGCCSRPKSQC